MKRITIEPVSRIEGHAKITIQLDDAGKVADTQFQVTQVRGFEKFTEGRPFYEMPGITSRICGICPISHQLASSKACDAIMAVRIPANRAIAARDHSLRPDRAVPRPQLLLPVGARPAAGHGRRSGHPQCRRRDRSESRAGAGRHRAAQVRSTNHRRSRRGAGASFVDRARRREVAHDGASSRPLPGGHSSGDGDHGEDSGHLQGYARFLCRGDRQFRLGPDHVCGMVDHAGNMQLYDGVLRFRGPDGEIVQDRSRSRELSASSSPKRRFPTLT